MQWSLCRLVACFGLLSGVLAANKQAINAFKRVDEMKEKMAQRNYERAVNERPLPLVARQSSPYANSNTTKFVVNGTGIPEVDFDIGVWRTTLLSPIQRMTDSSCRSRMLVCYLSLTIQMRPDSFSFGSSRVPTQMRPRK